MELKIDGKNFKNSLELHRYLKDKLSFPDYYGENLDALFDCLYGIKDLEIEFTNMDDLPGFISVFEDASVENGNIKVNVK